MRGKLKTLQHLLKVYKTLEELREAEAQRAAAEMREAEQAIALQRRHARKAVEEGRHALMEGDGAGWSYALAQHHLTESRCIRLQHVLEQRAERSQTALRRHLDSRVWSERFRSLTDGAQAAIVEQEERKAQSAADERHLVMMRRQRESRDDVQP